MNNDNFAGLKYFPDQRLNIRQIENIDTKSILRGNVKELLGVMNDLAYIDVEHDEYVGGTPQAKKLYRLCQYGLQYMMYTVTKLGDNTLLLKDYLQIQEDKTKNMQDLLKAQEETLKTLRQKKKSLQETEKHYQTLLKTFNLDPNTPEAQNLRRLGSYDSEQERREDTVPLHLPKGPYKKNSPKEGASSGINSQIQNPQYYGSGGGLYDPRGYSSQANDPRQPAINIYDSQYATKSTVYYPPGSNLYDDAPEKGEYRPPQYQQYQEIPHKRSEEYHPPSSGNNNKVEEPKKVEDGSRFNQYGAGRQKEAPTKLADQRGGKTDEEDEYEDDFELSESYAPDQQLKFPSRLGKPQQNKDSTSGVGKREDGIMEETISMDFDKEFNKGYIENLNKLVDKNKPDVELSVKRFS